MTLFEIYCEQNGIKSSEPIIELIERVFQDGLKTGFDAANKLKMISEETNNKIPEYSEENWDNFCHDLSTAFINRGRRLDAEFDAAVEKENKLNK